MVSMQREGAKLFAAGDVISTSYPFAHLLMHRERDKRCEECFKCDENLLKCSACSISRYCSKECQKKAWRYHKVECKGFQRVAPQIPKDSMLLLFRLLVEAKKSRNQEEQMLGKKRKFSNLISHHKDIAGDVVRCKEFSQVCEALMAFVAQDFSFPEPADVFVTFGKMCVNTFSICDAEMQPIGAGVYLGPSMLNHSCRPNAVVVYDGVQLSVRAIEDIYADDEITISYIDQLNTRKTRQKELRSTYYFICQCPVCQDVKMDEGMKSLKCTEENCDSPVLTTDIEIDEVESDEVYCAVMKCTGCGLDSFPVSYRVAKTDAVQSSKQVLKEAEHLKINKEFEKLLSMCECSLREQDSTLHTSNILHIKILDVLFDVCIELQLWDKAVHYGQRLVNVYGLYLHKYHPLVGVHYMKLGKIQLYLQQLSVAHSSLQQAEAVLAVSHGKTHPLYRDLRELLDDCVQEMNTADTSKLSIQADNS